MKLPHISPPRYLSLPYLYALQAIKKLQKTFPKYMLVGTCLAYMYVYDATDSVDRPTADRLTIWKGSVGRPQDSTAAEKASRRSLTYERRLVGNSHGHRQCSANGPSIHGMEETGGYHH